MKRDITVKSIEAKLAQGAKSFTDEEVVVLLNTIRVYRGIIKKLRGLL